MILGLLKEASATAILDEGLGQNLCFQKSHYNGLFGKSSAKDKVGTTRNFRDRDEVIKLIWEKVNGRKLTEREPLPQGTALENMGHEF